MFAFLAHAEPPPVAGGPKFALHQKVVASRDRSEQQYTGWIYEVIFGHGGAPASYKIRFCKQPEKEVKEIFAEAAITAHPQPGLSCLFPPRLPKLLTA